MEKNKVLIVDDISENIETISEMIKDFDIDVKTANGGKEAIELIDTFKPHVILLDFDDATCKWVGRNRPCTL